ncbi:g8057 [Coccomyxa elongata]
MAMSTAPPNHLEQTRQGEVLQSEQPASLQPEVTEPILAGQTVQLGSQDSLAFLVGLGVSAEAASHVLSTALSAASARSAGYYASTVPEWQMEAVCRTLVDLGVKVRDLGQLFVRCPPLLTCPADELCQQAEHIYAVLGEPAKKITKDACLANLLTSEPGIMVDQTTMERLESLASQVHRIGKGLPEECSSALCAVAYKCPHVFGMESVELLQSIRFLTLQLQLDSKGVLTLFTNHPDVLIRGIPSIFEALLAVLPLEKAELKAVVREHPLLLGVELEQAALVVKMLRVAGLNVDELSQLVKAFPGVLSKRPKDVQVKLAFLTKLLGQPAESMLGAPRLFFNKSVVSNIGPRFSFIKDCLPDCTTQWAPTTILRSSDEDFCMLTGAPVEQYAIYKKQWQEANGRRFRSSK